jgi:diguanylate cyclase (GGDEF)-like protein
MPTTPTLIDRLARSLGVDDDALAPYRARIAIHLSALSALLLLPFTLNHLLQGRWALAGTIALAQAVLVWDTLALRAGRRPPVPFWMMVVVLAAAVCYSTHVQQVNGSYWSYPTLFIAYFLLPRRQALPLSVVLVSGVSVLMAVGAGLPVAVRVLATLTLTLIMINVVLNVIGDLQRALERQAVTDPLTGAFNRRHFDTQLAALAAPPADADAVNVLMAVDIDHFKAINDRHGHATGDRVLQGVVALLNGRKRPSDSLFRTGGEEFVLLLPRIVPTDAVRLADALRQRVQQAALVEGQAVTVSIGVAPQRSGQGGSAWLRAADDALYEAKRGGRNRVVMAGSAPLESARATAP